MESIDPVWLFGGLALVGGTLLGSLLFRWFGPAADDVTKLKAELEQARGEMDSYKASVNSHFNKTSDLVNELTQDYVKVYRHLAEGAQTLSETREFTQVLDQPSGRVLISVEAETEQAPDPLEAETDQPSVAVEADAQDADSETTATEPVAVVDDAPVDYARVNQEDAVAGMTAEAESQDAVDIVVDDDEKVTAGSTNEVTPGENDSASEVDAEQQAVADAVDAEKQAVADEGATDSPRKS